MYSLMSEKALEYPFLMLGASAYLIVIVESGKRHNS